MNTEKPYMTEDQAESIILANEVGRFFGSRSELMHAHLLIAARNKRYEEEDAAESALADVKIREPRE